MQQEKIKAFIGKENIGIVNALQMMDVNGIGILFITDSNNRLVGTLTDGDVRRCLISTGNLDSDIRDIMGHNPRFLYEQDREMAADYMKEKRIKAAPILNEKHEIVDIVFNSKIYEELSSVQKQCLNGVPVIIMAGGKGTRLYPYTKILPKPLIPIGDVPIIERIMDRFSLYGADKFWITVNYKKEMIKSYFSDIQPSYNIEYVEEDMPLGTAGSIRLIKEKFDTPFIVTNCDILIEADYEKIVEYHNSSMNDMTIVSSLKNTVIPYGVLHTSEQGKIDSIEEKPQISYLVNTGMYIVNPDIVGLIPENVMFHMTDLADIMLKKGMRVGMYPLSEKSFLDMGEFSEMKKMEERINNGFDGNNK